MQEVIIGVSHVTVAVRELKTASGMIECSHSLTHTDTYTHTVLEYTAVTSFYGLTCASLSSVLLSDMPSIVSAL